MKRLFPLCAAAATAALLLSCASTNRLAEYRFYDAPLAAELRTPPAPTLDVFYRVTFDPHDPLRTALSVGSNIIKASEAEQAEARMRQALAAVDVPSLVQKETFAGVASALGARQVDSPRDADFRLVLDIHEYGIRAGSPGSGVSMTMDLTAGLYATVDRDLIWRRHLTLDMPASVQVFGVPHVVGNLVTAAVLANLTTEELEVGFRNLAGESARALARRLERDLDRAYAR